MHQSASRIESSFDCYRTLFTNNFSTIFNSMTMKENKYRSIECISVYASFIKSFFEQQDDDERKNVQSYQDATEDHWEISTQKKESSIQTVIWLINRRANSHEKNKSSSDFRTTQKTAYWRKNRNRTSLRPKVAQRTTLFQRSRAFLIKSLSVLPFLDAQGNKSRSVVTILSEITRLLRYLKYKAIASSIFYQKE